MLTTAGIKVKHKARDFYAKVMIRDPYMNRAEAEKAAEYRIPFLSFITEQIKLPKGETNWHHIFTATKQKLEAHVLPTHLRLRHRAQNTIASLHTLPRDHPIWDALRRAQKRRNNIGSNARFPLAEALKTMSLLRDWMN